MPFDFASISDILLTNDEMNSVARLFGKAKVNQTAWNCTQQAFFEAFVRCAKVAVPCNAVPSCVISQAILESGWFSTGTMFGVKATVAQEDAGNAVVVKSHEVVAGHMEKTIGTFFKGGIQQQFANYYAYLARRKPGTEKFLPADSMGFIDYLQDPRVLALDGTASGSYSTAGKSYSDAIVSIIRDNHLEVFDHA